MTTTHPEALEALALRCEQAKGPDRELDFWISVRDETKYTGAELQADIDLIGIEGMAIDAPFTGSLDAAMSLVPEGWDWAVDFCNDAEVQAAICSCDPGPYCEGKSRTLPLSLCAAALRARATTPSAVLQHGGGGE